MSKIYEAYRKKAGDQPDLAVEIGRASPVVLYGSPVGGQKNEFSQLASRLLSQKASHKVDRRGVLLSFASTASGEGASYVSYNTAVYLATIYHQEVAWIDANFLTPQRKLLQYDGPTLSSLLERPAGLDSLVRTGGLTLIPGGGGLAQNVGLFSHSQSRELFEELTRQFDFVIIDLPPALKTSDTALMASLTDGLLLVVRQRHLKREVVGHGLESLRAKSVNVLGAVINRRTYDLPKVIYDRL